MGLWPWRTKTRREEDPLAAYDRLIEDLERQGGEIRKSAATLLAMRGDLTRDAERCERRIGELAGRQEKARANADARSEAVLLSDRQEAERSLEAARLALTEAEGDAEVLIDAAKEIAQRVSELRAERVGARARLTVSQVVTGALRERSERIDRVLALDAARDEIERARALAQIYREDRQKTR